MAILNVTPDSFYAPSRISNVNILVARAKQMIADGASILDVGACSTRPGSTPATTEEEWHRLEPALEVLREYFPEISLSVDTFRVEIAQRVLKNFGRVIINDISGGNQAMYAIVREYQVPYIWTLRGHFDLLQNWDMMADMEIILDPGLGFTGGVATDYACLQRLNELTHYKRPILVGVSRKSMIWKRLNITPNDCLSATQVLHMFALQQGASILRVHDVKEARQTITLYNTLYNK